MTRLQRFTTEYIDAEDRIRLAGEIAPGRCVVAWLPQRLMNRLLPPLLGWLERQGAGMPHAELLHGFAQQAARAQLEPQAPVPAAAAGWLVLSADITPAETVLRITFRGGAGEAATLDLAPTPLRQWLSILCDQWRRAQWPLAVWPAWMEESVPAQAGAAPLALH